MDILDIPSRQDVGTDIEWLATQLRRGPKPMRRNLAAWARDYAAETAQSLAPEQLREVMRSLITLAHWHAAVSLVEPPNGFFARPEVAYEDLGGYSACMFSVVNVLDSLPLPEDEIVDLQSFARTLRAEQEAQIREGLLRRELRHQPLH